MSDNGPLSGVRVLDLTSVVVGPIATQTLADYGADVIKLEAPEGDMLRRLGGQSKSGQLSPKFIQLNRNKRSLALDVRAPAGREVLRKLLARADIVVANMRRPALARLGLDYETVRGLNPRIIHCTLTGFGKDGPYADKPAYDSIIQGVSGMAACNQLAHGEATYVPFVLADRMVGMIAVQLILLALRARDQSGESQCVEIPMFENAAAFVLQEHYGQQAFEPPRGEIGDKRLLDPHARPAQTRDGYICISANTDAQTHALFDIIGRPDLKTDPRFATMGARYTHVSAYFELRNAALREKSSAEWMALFEAHDIPAMPMHTLESLLDDPHLAAVGFFQTLDHPAEGRLRNLPPPSLFSGGARAVHQPAPLIGEHSAEVLAELGLSSAEIGALTAAGVLVHAPTPALTITGNPD